MATSAQVIGFVTALKGSATAISTDGVSRILALGDAVHLNEVIQTGDASAVMVEFTDGTRLDLGRNAEAMLDSSVFTPPGAEQAAEAIASVDAIQQAILAGEDPTALLAPTAAGPGAGEAGAPVDEGGTSYAVVELTGNSMTPDSGFETTGLGFEFLEPQPALVIEEEPVVNIVFVGDEGDAVEEGNPAEFLVTLSGPAGQPATVALSATDGTADSTDYNGVQFYYDAALTQPIPGNVLTFAPGQTAINVYVQTYNNDPPYGEANENFTVTAEALTGAQGTGAAIGVIMDSDLPTISIADAGTVSEGTTLAYVVSLNGASDQAVTADLGFAGSGTATGGSDYEVKFYADAGLTTEITSVTFNPGDTSQTVYVKTFNNDPPYNEVNETVDVSLSNISGANAGDVNATGTLTDGTLPTINISDAGPVEEGGVLAYTVSLNGASDQAVTADLAFSGGTADGTDYVTKFYADAGLTTEITSVTFNPGDTSQTVYVQTINNDPPYSEPDETVDVSLSNISGASAGDTLGVGTITDSSQANFLNGSLITNSNVTVQQTILTFVEENNPFKSYSKYILLDAQGQEGNLNQDVGFDINPDNTYAVSLEASAGTKTIVTDFSLEGVTIIDKNTQLDPQGTDVGGHKHFAITAAIDPEPGTNLVQPPVLSTDGTSGGDTLSDPSASVINYLYGAGGADTLNGGAGIDFLNGGGGADQVYGNGGNDILVYDAVDTVIDGGAGIDLLRIDGNPTANSTVDLTGKTSIHNIEGILITDDADSLASVGTTVKLSAADVLNFTDGNNVLHVMGNPGDYLDIGLTSGNADGWSTSGVPDVNGFVTYTAANGATLLVEDGTQVSVI